MLASFAQRDLLLQARLHLDSLCTSNPFSPSITHKGDAAAADCKAAVSYLDHAACHQSNRWLLMDEG